MEKILKELKIGLKLTITMMFICGFIYPIFILGIGNVFFESEAKGSLIKIHDNILGSKLIGQNFLDDRFLHSRPSAVNYNTFDEKNEALIASSGGFNQSVGNPKLIKRVQNNINDFLIKNPNVTKEKIPTDIVTASASGLDPNISLESANIQIERISKKTNISKKEIKSYIKQNTDTKWLGIFGESKVNVLGVNLEIAKKLKLI